MSRFFYNPITLLAITIVGVVFSLSLHKTAQKTQFSQQKLQEISQEIEQTKAEVGNLRVELNNSQQPFAKEKIIRDELLMKKKGEYVIQIPDELIKSKKQEKHTPPNSAWNEWKQLLL